MQKIEARIVPFCFVEFEGLKYQVYSSKDDMVTIRKAREKGYAYKTSDSERWSKKLIDCRGAGFAR